MRVNVYSIEINEQLPALVKERGVNYDCHGLTSPKEVVLMFREVFHTTKLAEEYFWVVGVNTRGRVLGVFEISHGTVNQSLVSPREIFVRLLLCGASSFLAVHNHPSGDAFPSKEDSVLTTRLKEAGELLSIRLLDHIILGDGYFSYKEHEML